MLIPLFLWSSIQLRLSITTIPNVWSAVLLRFLRAAIPSLTCDMSLSTALQIPRDRLLTIIRISLFLRTSVTLDAEIHVLRHSREPLGATAVIAAAARIITLSPQPFSTRSMFDVAVPILQELRFFDIVVSRVLTDPTRRLVLVTPVLVDRTVEQQILLTPFRPALSRVRTRLLAHLHVRHADILIPPRLIRDPQALKRS